MPKINLSTKIPDETAALLRAFCRDTGRKIGYVITEAIREYLRAHARRTS